MHLKEIFADKTIKPKDKTTQVSQLILNKDMSIDDLIVFAKSAKEPVKASCIEAMEFATQTKPEILTENGMSFVLESLNDKAPRIKWESAKVVHNAIHLLPHKVDEAINKLIVNTTDSGTVVRWSAATALSKIILLKTNINETLVPALQVIMENEEKGSIKKIYAAAIKNLSK